MPEFKNITLEIADRVATLVLNRPYARNSLNTEALSEIHRALGVVEDNEDAASSC